LCDSAREEKSVIKKIKKKKEEKEDEIGKRKEERKIKKKNFDEFRSRKKFIISDLTRREYFFHVSRAETKRKPIFYFAVSRPRSFSPQVSLFSGFLFFSEHAFVSPETREVRRGERSQGT